MKAKNYETTTDLSQILLIDGIINIMQKKHLSESSINTAMPLIQQLARRLGISDDAAMIFAAFFDSFSEIRILVSDIALFFNCTQVKILTYWHAIEELIQHKYIRQIKDRDGDAYYIVPNEIVEVIRTNTTYMPKLYKNLSIEQWITELAQVMDKKKHNHISFSEFKETLMLLIHNNKHLTIANELGTLSDYELDDLIVLITMLNLYIQNNDEHIIQSDIEDMLEYPWDMRSHSRQLERGKHPLQQAGLIENCEDNGLAVKDAWKLTTAAKTRFLPEVETTTPLNGDYDRNIMQPDAITPKQLFFNSTITQQLQQLETLLGAERFAVVQKNLAAHGMRRGFTCIFYGEPGTGKTESALQIARNTGRALMVVDVPNLRSKWVGDSEKNIKALFDKYKNYCKRNGCAPILLFNEADAILCKRNEGAVNSVDKMENALQNIILQEMETLEGIMIATTNLTGNLDPAFERRFLYKIEFPKPSPYESQHIWHSMLPEISEQDAFGLAKQYSFSGGQIENIARKQIVNAVLTGDDCVNMAAIQEACKTELFNRSGSRKIGFY